MPQPSSPEFGEAIEAPSITLTPPQVRGSWYGGNPTPPGIDAVLKIQDTMARLSSPGWGTSSDGNIVYGHVGSTANYEVNGSAGVIHVPANDTTLLVHTDGTFQDLDLTYRVWTTVAITGQDVETGPTFRIDPNDISGSFYRMSVMFWPDGSVKLRWLKQTNLGLLVMYSDQVGTDSMTLVDVFHAANEKVWIRAQVVSNILRGKVWADGQPEPPDWHLTFTDPTDVYDYLGHGGIGAVAWGVNSNTKPIDFYVDNVSLIDLQVLDDFTPVTGGSYSISHGMDDGFPDAVTSTSGGNEPVGSLTASLIGNRVGGVRMDARQLFSPWNTDSPYYGLPRDIARLQLDQGVMTSIGEENIRLFTGQMADITISGREAVLQGISRTRLLLSKAIKPPVVEGQEMGGNATWLISYLLWASGINIAPRPDERALQFYAPMHGSTRPFVPASNGGVEYEARKFSSPGVFVHTKPEFIDGPYLLAVDSNRYNNVGTDFGYGALVTRRQKENWGFPFFCAPYCEGRLQFWIRGVAHHSTDGWMADWRISDKDGIAFINLGISETRELVILLEDGSGTAGGGDDRTFSTGLILPQDDEWHAAGFYYNWNQNSLVVRLDGKEVSITPSPGLVVDHLPGWDNIEVGYPEFWTTAPVAEVQFYSGPYSNPIGNGWNDYLTRSVGPVISTEDFEDITYVTGIAGTWARSNTRAQAGTWSMKSGTITDSQTTDMTVTLPAGTESIEFYYWVSSEEGFDLFEVYANGTTLLLEDSGIPGVWQFVTIDLPVGTTTVVFRYSKDSSVAEGEDAVWIDQLTFRDSAIVTNNWIPEAMVRPIDLELEAIAEPTAREAWGWIAELCQSAMTAMRTNELDRLMILSPSWFVEPEQLGTPDVISTDWNAKDPDIILDPSKIRNSVQVDFNETRVDTAWAFVLSIKSVIAIPKGKSTQQFTLDTLAVYIDEEITTEPDNSPLVPISSKLWANTKVDGTGTILGSGTFTAKVISWDAGSVVVEFDNRHSATAYLVHNYQEDLPFFAIAGRGVYSGEAAASVQDTQQLRDERTVTVQATAMQRRDNARRLAANLLFWTRRARAEVSITVMGDPRRQPGDLVSLVDAEGTKIAGYWRPLVIEHRKSGGEFTQALHLKEAVSVSKWDDAENGWDEGVWDL